MKNNCRLFRSSTIMTIFSFVLLSNLSACLTSYSNIFPMVVSSIYNSNSSIPYAKTYSIGQLSIGQKVNFSVQQVDQFGVTWSTDSQHCIFITNNDTSVKSIDYYGTSNSTYLINKTDFYSLVIFQYIDVAYQFNENALSRYLITLQVVGTPNIYNYVSILSYYYEKFLYINATQNLTFSISSSANLTNQNLVLIQTTSSNKYVFSSTTIKSITINKVSAFNYTFTFAIPGGFYYVLRAYDTRNTNNYTVNYFSDFYDCPYTLNYLDSYEIFKPCLCFSCLNCSADSNSNGSVVVSGNSLKCVCNSNFFWNPTTQKCERNCTNFNSNSCGNSDCQSVSFWNGVSCIQCSLIANNNLGQTITTNNIIQCLCLSNFYWNPSSWKCDSNCLSFNNISCGAGDCSNISFYSFNACIQCSLIANSSTLVSSSTGGALKCKCKTNFYWNPSSKACDMNCSNFSSNFCGADDCQGISFWSGSVCVQCSLIANNNLGMVSSTYSVMKCVCLTNFYWNPATLNCQPNCFNFNSQYCAIGDCAAISLYSSLKNKCLQCSFIANSNNSSSSSNPPKCICKVGFYWNPDSQQCQPNCSSFKQYYCGAGDCQNISIWNGSTCIQCSLIANNNQGKFITAFGITKCLCLSNFYWNPYSWNCDFNCLSFNSINCGAGDCSKISFYNSSSCIQCGLIANSNTVVSLSTFGGQKCSCQANYYWNLNSLMCESSCSSFKSNNCGFDDCQSISFWSGSVCVQCSLKPNNLQGQIITNKNVSKCACLVNYYWNPTTLMCESNCLNFNSQNCGAGDCQNISFYSLNKCIQCSLINNSKALVNSSSTGMKKCTCSANFFWNPSSQSCQPNCLNFNSYYCAAEDCQNISFWSGSSCVQCSLITNNKDGKIVAKNSNSKCACLNNFYWNPITFKCQSSCLSFSSQNCGKSSFGDCFNAFWNGTNCNLCSMITHTEPKTNNLVENSCLCSVNFAWFNFQCSNTININCTNAFKTSCEVDICANYTWNGTVCTQNVTSTSTSESNENSVSIAGVTCGVIFGFCLIIIPIIFFKNWQKIKNCCGRPAYVPVHIPGYKFPNDECSICLDLHTDLVLHCNHLFHIQCYRTWRQTRRNAGQIVACPLDRRVDTGFYRRVCTDCRICNQVLIEDIFRLEDQPVFHCQGLV